MSRNKDLVTATHDTLDGSNPRTESQVDFNARTIDDETAVSPAPVATAERGWKEEGIDENAQLGVQKAQATTLTWSKTALYTTLGW